MTVTERKERQRAQREQLFLDKAAELIARDGILQLQMAPLAKACDYATGTLYQHFSSKEDLLIALVGRNSCHQLRFFQGIAALDISNREKMLALCLAEEMNQQYYPSHAGLAQYVFTEVVWQNASAARREAILANSKPLADLVSGIVQQAIDNAELPAHNCDAFDLSVAPWALCVGTNSLHQTEGLLEAFGGNKDPLQRYRHLHMLLNGMQWQPLMDLRDRKAMAQQIASIETLLRPWFTSCNAE